MTVYAVRATMVDGRPTNLLLFSREEDATKYITYVREHCRLLGFDSVEVVTQRIIGPEPIDRRRTRNNYTGQARRRTDV